MSWDVIIPFLRPIENLLRDPEVSDILVNGSSRVFIEKDGDMQEVAGVSIAEKSLQVAVRNIARALGDDISPEQPLLDARLPAAIPPTIYARVGDIPAATIAVVALLFVLRRRFARRKS